MEFQAKSRDCSRDSIEEGYKKATIRKRRNQKEALNRNW